MAVSPATWTSLSYFSNGIPESVTDGLKSLSDSLVYIDTVAAGILGILDTAEKYLAGLFTNPINLITGLIAGFLQNGITMLTDTMSLGGGLIVIFPYNVVKNDGTPKYIVNLLEPLNIALDSASATTQVFKPISTRGLPKPGSNKVLSGKEKNLGNKNKYNAPLATLTPRQAFNEFYLSFDNTKDTHRPRWTENDVVVGFGIVITSPNISSFLNLAATMAQFLDFSGLLESVNTVFKDVQSAISNAQSQDNDIRSDSVVDFSRFKADMSAIIDTNATLQSGDKSKALKTLRSLVESEDIAGYHWIGLSLRNFPFLQTMVLIIEDLLKKLNAVTTTPTINPLTSIIQAVKKKIIAIRQIVTLANLAVETIVTSLGNTGIYSFTIPEGSGSNRYVQESLALSLQDPNNPLKGVMDTSQFTILAFAGASVGVNTKAWSDMLKNTFDASMDKLKSNYDDLFTPFNYNVRPDFKTKTFRFGEKLTLFILSSQSTSDYKYYYTFAIRDNENSIIAQHNQTDPFADDVAIVNTSRFNIQLPTPNFESGVAVKFDYTIDITLFDILTKKYYYHASFPVTNSSLTLPFNVKDGEQSIPSTADANTKIKITSGSRVIEEINIPEGGDIVFGSNITGDMSDLNININGIIRPIDNFKGYPTFDVASIQDFITNRFLRLTELPTMLCFNFVGVLSYGLAGGTMTSVNLPACILISTEDIYEFSFIDENGVLWGPYYITITVGDVATAHLC
jgi:hypothetical protein